MGNAVKIIEGIEDCTPDPDNANLGTERGLRMLDDSLREDGAGRSILVDRDGVTIAGAKTLERAADIGLPIRVVQTDGTELVVVQRTDLDLDGEGDEQVRARRMAYRDNRSSEVGLAWDPDQLLADLEAGFDFDGLFGDAELAEVLAGMLEEPPEDPGPQIDRAQELQEKWKVKRGDVWEIPSQTMPGKCHWVMCGDSTDMESVDRLWQGEKVKAVLADPPYGIAIVKKSKVGPGGKLGFVGYSGAVAAHTYKPIVGDDKPFDPEHLLNLADVVVLFGANNYCDKLPPSTAWIVWDKDAGTGAGPNFSDCELAWTNQVGRIKKFTHLWKGLARAGSRSEDGVSRIHPTQKPVALFKWLLEEFTERGDCCYDPYLGSGTTLVACEVTGRVGLGMEIDGAYVAVTLERLAELTGESPVCVSDR